MIAAGIAVERRAARTIHANVVAGFMQDRVQRRIGANVQPVADEPGFALAPVRAVDCAAERQLDRLEPEALQQLAHSSEAVLDQDHCSPRRRAAARTRSSSEVAHVSRRSMNAGAPSLSPASSSSMRAYSLIESKPNIEPLP